MKTSVGITARLRKSEFITTHKINTLTLTILFTLFFALVFNAKIWSIYFEHHPIVSAIDTLQLLSFFGFLFFLLFALFNLLAIPYFQKYSYMALALSSSAALYFSIHLNTYFDETMMQNVFETNFLEASELITPSFIQSLIIFGVVPAFIIFKLNIQYRPAIKQLLSNVAYSAISLILALGSAYPFYSDHASFVRNNNLALIGSLQPSSYLSSSYRYLKPFVIDTTVVRKVLDEKPAVSTTWKNYSKPLVLVFIVGETARASSFSLQKSAESEFLNNPNITYFPDFSACGTSTAVSVPCMFSTFSRNDFNRNTNREYENIIDIIHRVGFSVTWKDNSNGCKGVCAAIGTEYLNNTTDAKFYNEGNFYDEALIDGLSERISKSQNNQVFVLHQLGSHGPAYYKRLPDEFIISKPACLSQAFSDCSAEAIQNTYNDTVRYTEYLIGKMIKQLEDLSDNYDTALVYVSDHGESTGENGLYLHGIPRAIAPVEQTHVPALVWMSDAYQITRGISSQCLNQQRLQTYSHDNISHTLLGLLDIKTSVYEPQLDITANCRKQPSNIAAMLSDENDT